MMRDAQRIDHMLILFETVKTQFAELERQLDRLQGEYPL